MPPANARAKESQLQKEKLARSYQELLEEFSAKDLRNVGSYALGRLIGKGSFGKVYLAYHKLTNGSKVVLKSSRKDDANLAREIHHHRQFLHPHIARLYEVIVTENLVWLVLEYCPGDELYNYLLNHGPMPIEKVQKIFTQLVGAVSYVHSKSCVHRDLKLENILLDKHGDVKLCDFGFTREYEGRAAHLQTFCGTVCYSAPEMLKGEKYAGERVDVWSLGIILYALIAGELPYDEDDDQATKTRIMTEDPKYNDRFPDDAKSLINQLLSKRPLLRPTLSDVLAHPFLAEHAPQQQAILKLTRPAPFTTPLEKTTLERMRSAGVNTDQVVESVIAQKCDSLAGWWALLIEKEERKEKRRERKRREREAEAKNLRRLSAASSRLERISAALVEVEEEGQSSEPPRSRGRRERRSIPNPQLMIPDLPKLPETTTQMVVASPDSIAPPPIAKDGSRRSLSSTRNPPAPPPKERRVSRGSTLHISASQPELMRPRGILRRQGTRRRQHPIISQLAALKHWLVESTKRAKSPTQSKAFGAAGAPLRFLTEKTGASKNKQAEPKQQQQQQQEQQPQQRQQQQGQQQQGQPQMTTPTNQTFGQAQQSSTPAKRSSNASSLTPSNASYPGAVRPSSITQPPRPFNGNSSNRNSLSPSPLTPRNSYRRSSAGLRGRKSTSSSVSSIRSIHHKHSHSKASSASSKSADTNSTPVGTSGKALPRSPHTSVKVLPTTPNATSHLPSGIRVVRGGNNHNTNAAGSSGLHSTYNESAPAPLMSSPASSLVFARRKRSAFKGPAIGTSLSGAPPMGSPSLPRPDKHGEEGVEKLAMGARKSQVIEEEEEAGSFHTDEELEEEYIEEVDAFSPVDETSPSSPGPGRGNSMDRDDALAALTGTVPSRSDDRMGTSSSGTGASKSASVRAKGSEERIPAGATTASLLPAVEIPQLQESQSSPVQPKLTPFQPMPPTDAEGTPIHPPRSSSIRERKPGTAGSAVTVESGKAEEDKPLPPPAEEKPGAEKEPEHVAQKESEK